MRIETVGDSLFWSYANLGMAHAAVENAATSYGPMHYAIRNRLYTGLKRGTLEMWPLVADERLKMVLPQACAYCGSPESLAADHLIPRKRGGADRGENLVWACRSCNGSKGAEDVLVWLARRGEFPPLLLLRRYLKLAVAHGREVGALPLPLSDGIPVPFEIAAVPHRYPAPERLRLWVTDLGGSWHPDPSRELG